ncbi:MAG: isoleucine--tRNA ligase [Alphaproteobacteria bacterium]|nr:isoleucine--tRNA ligase [Alphaproteobacteria bacterium]
MDHKNLDYKNTVFLPKTNFSMKAGLAKREPELIKYWQDIDLHRRLRNTAKNKKKFILHFGPPYANGHIHIGHALSYILKDIVTKTYQMKGCDAPLVPGWDCHGLPIEWKVEENYRAHGKKKEEIPVLEFLAECRSFASKWIGVQKEELKRLGIIADWDDPYKTMDPKTESRIAEQILKFHMNGLLYRGLKPVLWSVVEGTALAEAEVEYRDHTSHSIYVAFKIVKASIPLLEGASMVIWTTTPWTLPGNRGIAYGPEFTYTLIEVIDGTDLIAAGKRFVIAHDLVQEFVTKTGIQNYASIGTVKGGELAGTISAHPWRGHGYDFDVPLIPGDHVTTDSGTGLVHTAPGHGVEDFGVGQTYGLEVPATVQADGTYYAHVPLFAGDHVYKVAPRILEELRNVGALLHSGKITHSYPHSWRSKTPLIYRATSQWFVDIDAVRQKAVDAIHGVEWFPAQGKNRILSMVEKRPDWCLSRQRTWGVPIALFVHHETGEPLRDPAVNGRIVQAIADEGIEAWQRHDSSYFLGSKYKADDYEKVSDIVDVWFDSACTHHFVLEDRPNLTWPADLYFEGSDQHRGWFQSSLIESCGITGKAPYRQVVTHGFVLDEKGYKMSKSSGNVVAPDEIVNTLGADLLRLWVVGSDYTQDLRIGKEILKYQEDIYRRLRNTLRYLLGALNGHSDDETVSHDDLPSLEKYILHQLKNLETLHQQCLVDYDFSAFYTALHTFCAMDLSAFYFDIRKDSLYCDAPDSLKRRSTRTVMNHVFLSLVHWLAPVLSFTAEEAWHDYKGDQKTSIHEQLFPELPDDWFDADLANRWETVRTIRKVITNTLELERSAKTIGSSLQAQVVVYGTSEVAALFESLDVDLAELSITSGAKMVIAQPPASAVTADDLEDIGVIASLAEGAKCPRCWRVLPEVGQATMSNSRAVTERPHPDLCHRCEDAIGEG